MFFKYYPITILITSLLLGVYIYTLSNENFIWTIPFSDITYDMPVAVWIVVIVLIFFFITIIFIFSERLISFMEQNSIKQDKNALIEKIKYKIIQKDDKDIRVKTKIFKELSSIIDNLTLSPKDNPSNCENKEITKLLAMYGNLKNGEEIDIHKFHIPQTSELFTINAKNMISKNYKNGFPILKNKNYIYELKKIAFIELLKNGTKSEIEKYKDSISYDKEIVFVILECFLNKQVEFTKQDLSKMVKNAKFTSDDYLTLAKNSKGKIEPSEWIRIFKYLADQDELAEEAYLYILLELEMLDNAKNRLKSHAKYDFANIRAYLDLKACGKSYPIDIFF